MFWKKAFLFLIYKYCSYICIVKLDEWFFINRRVTDNAHINLLGFFYALFIRYRRLLFPVYFALRGWIHEFDDGKCVAVFFYTYSQTREFMNSTTTNTRLSAGSVKSDNIQDSMTVCNSSNNVARTSLFIKVLLSDGTLIEDTQWQSMEDLHIVLSNFCESYYPDHEGFILIESLEPDGSRKIEEIHAITKDYLRDMGITE